MAKAKTETETKTTNENIKNLTKMVSDMTNILSSQKAEIDELKISGSGGQFTAKSLVEIMEEQKRIKGNRRAEVAKVQNDKHQQRFRILKNFLDRNVYYASNDNKDPMSKTIAWAYTKKDEKTLLRIIKKFDRFREQAEKDGIFDKLDKINASKGN